MEPRGAKKMAIADAFEKGLYWAFYHYLEDDLIEYMRKVPYIDEHKHVHSPALLAQLLLNCSYIDTAFKDMHVTPDLPGTQLAKE